MTDAVDLVCGPASPRPGSEHSYRLTRRLGAGGQAEVYKAVRLSAGVSSTALTVKVFRLNPDGDREQQFNSWDKGDAVLMDLGGRGAPNICRRIDAFYGPPPHQLGEQSNSQPVPYQVLEYLPGHDLRELITERLGRVDAVTTLNSVVDILKHLHRPQIPGAHPVLHMDIKPANIIIGPDGGAKLIDFTGARYYTPAHLTTISYTRETAGPEAYQGKVGPSYDVHGFGSVAYFLVTGASARTDSPGHEYSVPWSQLRRHPVLEANSRLREHLLAPLADNPADRPLTTDLEQWIEELTSLVHSSHVPDLGADWGPSAGATTVIAPSAGAGHRPHTPSAPARGIQYASAAALAGAAARGTASAGTSVGSASVSSSPVSAAPVSSSPISGSAAVNSATPSSGGPDSTRLIDPAAFNAAPAAPPASSEAPTTMTPGGWSPSPQQPPSSPLANRPGKDGQGKGGYASGRATYSPPSEKADHNSGDYAPHQEEEVPPLLGPPGSLKRGSELTIIGMLFAFVSWGIWVFDLANDDLGTNFMMFLFIAAMSIGVFFLARVIGGYIWGRVFKAQRRTARLAHLAAGSFLAVIAFYWLGQVSLFTEVGEWLGDLF
ncbi:protein kinase domain-containing protein [Natronoglycomyces albus]|uniref:non-specific serine/threonine protein kinase n=1 Tax=Natronoglycomyces albus TaxID=2811108 RepID=A0A895XVN2_9ACTN|nr:hypothetical protein [Natronoglycomyces albus]QSB06280.1 hypothetical protein JQS30_05060 [Natronoglycomyces albus]